MIRIDKEPYAIDCWYSGTYTKDVGDDLEYKEENYDFTIHYSENYTTLTWIEEVPENEDEIEKQIMKQFNQTI